MEISKNLLYGIIGFLLAGAITFGILDRFYKKKVDRIESSYTAQLGGLQDDRDSLKIHSDSIDVLLTIYKAKIDSLGQIDVNHKVEIDRLEDELAAALNDMWDQYLEDQGLYAYDYLQGRYLSKDTLEYLFSGQQVTHMATDIIKGDYLDSLLVIEQDRTLSLQQQVLNYKEIESILIDERDDFALLTVDLQMRLETAIRENQLSAEEIARLEKALRKWRLGGAGAGIGLALLLILL